jgi:flagellar hook-associated protein 1 FlgK
MSSLGINIGLKSLLSAQAHLETIGHNLSNANTPGYSRQSLQVSSSSPVQIRGLMQGTGLDARSITRTVDRILQGRITSQVSSLGKLDARLETASSVESLLGGTGEGGLPALFKKMFQSFASLSTAPEDSVLRTGAVQSVAGLSSSIQKLAGDTEQLERNVFLQMQANISEVNNLAQSIGDLNRQIVSSEFGTSTANDLRDQRDQKLKELSGYIDVRAVEDARGAVRVLVGGRILVSPTTTEKMTIGGDPASGNVQLLIDGQSVDALGGRLGGLLQLQSSYLPGLSDKFDAFARNLILESNRVHSTGVPRSGPFSVLVAQNQVVDGDGDGALGDELLSRAGLPFDVTSGSLYLNVVDRATGALRKHEVQVDATHTTVDQFAASLSAIPHVSASLDSQGRLQIVADAGFGFDFSPRLDTSPDDHDTFGSGRASIATGAEPFALAPGDTLDFVGANGPVSVALPSTAFFTMNAATADELAAALNADAGFRSGGLRAASVDGKLFVQSSGSGASESFQIAGGSALPALGLVAGTTVTGSDHAVNPVISGKYAGASNGRWTFRPNMDGTIGTTPGLRIGVYDETGTRLTELDVGPGYTPGDELDVLSGVKVAFGFGDVSAAEGDTFQLDVVGDSDTSDVLVALGLNSLFTGADASTIAVRADLLRDPGLLSTSLSGASGDGGNVLRFLEVESQSLAAFGDRSLDENLSGIVSGVALEIDASSGAREAEQFLLDGLETQRDQVSGVNTDEELVKMIEQEQSYQAAAQFLRVVSDLTAELMGIL